VDTYAGGLPAGAPDLFERAKALRQRFPAVQVTLTGEVEQDLAAIKTLRRALGDQAPLLADAAGQYAEPETARRVGQALERAEVFWFEDPLPEGQWEQYAALRPAIGPALAAGKGLHDLRSFQAALGAEALDAVVADLTLCGGLSAGQRVAELARQQGARVSFRGGKWPLSQLAAAQITAAHWNAGPMQVEPVPDLLRELLDPAPVFKKGFLRLPEGPGLGTPVQESFVERYRVELPEHE
jgi:L-alanine-DL-glutamate epimerase-like enolase superfamily enzyme